MSTSHRPRFQTTLSRRIFNSALAIWCLLPFFALWCLSPFAPLELSLVGIRLLAIVWALSFLTVCNGLLRVILRSPATDQSLSMLQCHLGLVCTLTIGFPSIALGVFPLIREQISSLRDPYSAGVRIDLAESLSSSASGRQPPHWSASSCPPASQKTKYYFLIDVSESFLTPKLIPLIEKVIKDLTVKSGFLERTWRTSDPSAVWLFAGDYKKIPEEEEDPEVRSREVLREISEGKLVNYLRGLNLKPDQTDVLTYLGKIHRSHSRDTCVKVVLFSDLVQSVRPEENFLTKEAIALEADSLASDIREQGSMAIVAFSKQALAPEDAAGVNLDLRNYFENHLRQSGQWREISLQEYAGKQESSGKDLMLDVLYRRQGDFEPLTLKYSMVPLYQSRKSFFYLPAAERDDETVVVQLIRSASSPSDVRIDLLDLSSEKSIGFLNGKQSALSIALNASGRGIIVAVDPASVDAIEKEQIKLVVAFPRRSSLYRIPLILKSIVDEGVFSFLRDVLFILNFLPLILAIHLWSLKEAS